MVVVQPMTATLSLRPSLQSKRSRPKISLTHGTIVTLLNEIMIVLACRCVIIIEGCEESGSPDLPFYIDKLSSRIGVPSLVICLDSGYRSCISILNLNCSGSCNYEQFWLTTSLRGLVVGTLRVKMLSEGVHSGGARFEIDFHTRDS